MTARTTTSAWCHRATLCMRSATRERWDPLAGRYVPVCEEHARDATPFELVPLGTEARRQGAR